MATYGPEKFTTTSGIVVTFRHCDESDVPAFLELQPKIAAETTHTLQVAGRVPERERLCDVWVADRENPISLRLGCFLNEKMIGQLSFAPERQPFHPWTAHIGRFGMFVLQGFWGEGIGRKLLKTMETHARAVGISRIEATVRSNNRRAITLYSRSGYEIEGTRRNAARIHGEMCDELFIAKVLSDDSTWAPPTLETERLILRALSISDAPAIFEYAKNPNVSRYTLWEPHTTLHDSEAYIFDYAFPHYRRKTPEPFGIVLKSNPSQVIGTVGCFWVSAPAKSMELAYAVAEPLWGHGVAAEASRAVVDYCFSAFGLVRIQARCKAENTASARVMEKIGMTFEGTLKSSLFHRGRHWDMHYYAALRH